MNDVTLRAFHDELEKIAARAGLRVIRNLVSRGGEGAMEQASQLAKTPGVLKRTAPGSQIKALGGGAEAQAHLVADPEMGVAVRKLYDPMSGVATPTMVGRKMQFAKDMAGNPMVAETKGFRRTPTGGRMTFHEYSPGGGPVPKGTEEAAFRSKLQDAAGQKGWQLGDVRAENISGGKSIDLIPLRPGEFTGDSSTLGGDLSSRITKKFKNTVGMTKQIGRHFGVDKGTATNILANRDVSASAVREMRNAMAAQRPEARVRRMGRLLGAPKGKGYAQSTVEQPLAARTAPVSAAPRPTPRPVALSGQSSPTGTALTAQPQLSGNVSPTGTALFA